MPGVSLVLPAFNEAANILPCIEQARAVLSALGPRWQIVVVDDGSTDETWALLSAVARDEPRLRLVRHAENRGYGAALKSGFAAAELPRVVIVDADLQLDLDELPRLLAQAGGHDIVAGYRAPRRDPLHRRVNARAWGWLVGSLFDVPARDVNCAFKVVDRRVLERIEIRSGGAFVSTELLVRAQAAGFSLVEVPVSHRPRRAGVPTGARPRVVLRAFGELAGLYRELRELSPARP